MRAFANARLTLFGFLVTAVIIGLFAGTVMLGHDYMRVGVMQGDLTAIEKYKLATQAFREKYGYLPGDMPAALVMQLKFTSRDGSEGRGDGNGLIEGVTYTNNSVHGFVQTGEPFFFWEDLTSAILIKEKFTAAGDVEPGEDIKVADAYLPDAHMGKGNRIYVYSDNNKNYYGISVVTRIDGNIGTLESHPGLTAGEAYDIDRKIDDGSPLTGNVLARYVSGQAIASSPDSCYDKASGNYSLAKRSDPSVNCGLSFLF